MRLKKTSSFSSDFIPSDAEKKNFIKEKDRLSKKLIGALVSNTDINKTGIVVSLEGRETMNFLTGITLHILAKVLSSEGIEKWDINSLKLIETNCHKAVK